MRASGRTGKSRRRFSSWKILATESQKGFSPGVPAKPWSVGSSSPGPGFPSLQNGNAEVGECLVLTAHADPDSRLCAGSLLRRQTLCGQAGCCSFHASLTGPRLLLL